MGKRVGTTRRDPSGPVVAVDVNDIRGQARSYKSAGRSRRLRTRRPFHPYRDRASSRRPSPSPSS